MSSAFKFSSKICTNNVTNCDQTIQYDLFNSWVHIEYNDLNYTDYKFFQNSNDPWFFTQAACCKIFSFNTAKKMKTLTSMIVTTNLKKLMTKTALYY